ncbi:MAG: serine protease, partial [Methylovirgula sp.]
MVRTATGLALALSVAVLLMLGPPAARAGHAPDSFADLAAQVSDAVVNISATQAYEDQSAGGEPELDPGTPFDDLFDEFFRHHQDQGGDSEQLINPHERRSNSLGSGFVIDPSGIIVTNNHVIADSDDVTVIFT